jgi:hypothetical protein
MKYNDKLHYFFKSKGITQRELSEVLGHNYTMIGRYLSGTSEFGPTFIIKLLTHYPDLDLNQLFREDAGIKEPLKKKKEPFDMDSELEKMEKNLAEIRRHLARKSHGKK